MQAEKSKSEIAVEAKEQAEKIISDAKAEIEQEKEKNDCRNKIGNRRTGGGGDGESDRGKDGRKKRQGID